MYHTHTRSLRSSRPLYLLVHVIGLTDISASLPALPCQCDFRSRRGTKDPVWVPGGVLWSEGWCMHSMRIRQLLPGPGQPVSLRGGCRNFNFFVAIFFEQKLEDGEFAINKNLKNGEFATYCRSKGKEWVWRGVWLVIVFIRHPLPPRRNRQCMYTKTGSDRVLPSTDRGRSSIILFKNRFKEIEREAYRVNVRVLFVCIFVLVRVCACVHLRRN